MTLGNSPKQNTVFQVEARKAFAVALWFKRVNQDTEDVVNITGCELSFTAQAPARQGGATVITSVIELAQPTLGYAQLNLQAADLELAAGEYPFIITMLTAENYPQALCKGVIVITDNPESAWVEEAYASVNPPESLTITFQQNNSITVHADFAGVQTLEIGEVDSIPYGADPTAEFTGNYPKQVLNLGIPRGQQGTVSLEEIEDEILTPGTVTNDGVLAGINAEVNTPGTPTHTALLAQQTASIGQQVEVGYVPEVMLIGAGIDYTGAADSTTAIQAMITAAAAGTILRFKAGVVKFSTLTLTQGKSLVGAGIMSYRDGAEVFGDSNYANNSFFKGTVLRSTATSGTAITISDSSTVQAACLSGFHLIGPGSGTSKGLVIGSLTHTIINPRVQVAVSNFATGVQTLNINEGLLDLTVRGCTTGATFESNTNSVRILFNAQRCVTGGQTDSSTIALNFISPITQSCSGTGLVINGTRHVIQNSYAESGVTGASWGIDVVSGDGTAIITPFGSSASDTTRVQAAVTNIRLIGCDLTKVTDASTTSVTDVARPWVAVSGGVGFQNSYVNGTGYATNFRRTPDGRHVECVGAVMTGAGGAVCFAFPTGYKPNSQKLLLVGNATAGTTLQAIVASNGNVTIFGGAVGDIRTFNWIFPLDL